MDKDQALLEALQNSYSDIIATPKESSYQQLRTLSAKHMQKAFSTVQVEIKGSENLPTEQGVIFIYNHLHNHPFFTVAKDFQITLDSHFISSVILEKYYKNPGTRVVRYALPDEENHKQYYDKFHYIRVYAKNYIPEGLSKAQIKKANKQFYLQATEVLESNTNLVFSPEGSSYYTEASPGPFLKGIFKFASNQKQQPLIVPIVMANFDKLPSKAPFKCQIMPPFRMRDFGVYSADSDHLNGTVETINQNFKKWVTALSKDDKNFEREIAVLKRRIHQKENKKDLLVFYGSSTIRLWKNIDRDFPMWNILNLGFGGAFIHSLSDYFEPLFQNLEPTVIVLYLGGNDLTLGYSAKKITEEILIFLEKIHTKFPKAKIYNISIKPSLEREHELAKIKEINTCLKEKSTQIPYLFQIDFYPQMIRDNRIREELFLQDGLHLNLDGYQVLKQAIEEQLHQHA
jgi:lysophospholipase L1-like esterase